MTKSTPDQFHDTLRKLINSSRFNEAFASLLNSISRFPTLGAECERLNSLQTTYRYLLDFMASGHSDPSRDKVLNELKENLSRINDLLLREERLAYSSDPYSTAKRLQVLKKSSFLSRYSEFRSAVEEDYKNSLGKEGLLISTHQLDTLDSLFNYVWTIFGADRADYELLEEALNDSLFPDYAKKSVVGAILLGNLDYFDRESFKILLDIIENINDLDLKARTAVSIALISGTHCSRIQRIQELKEKLESLLKNEDLKLLFNDIFINITRTYDTKRITQKMRDEVIPSLMKIDPSIIERMRNLASDAEDFLSDINPEWEELIEESGIQDKIQEINDLQIEGADVMMTTFSNLKNFPFFNSVSNWFLPYIENYPAFAELSSITSDGKLPDLSVAMCDSDIYSFLFSLKSMPSFQKEMMLKNLGLQMREAAEALTSSIGESETSITQRSVRHFLQDLYRFFSIYRKKDDFKNPFSSPLSKEELTPLSSLFEISLTTIKSIADFYFRYRYYPQAASILELIDSLQPGDGGIWEKIGYCYDRMHLYSKALEWYRKAEILNPESTWIEKKLAVCLKNSGNTQDAIHYYKRVLEKDSENYNLLMSAGQCLLDAERYEDALKEFFHAQYISPEKKDPLRAIAWTRLLSLNKEKASEDYDRLLATENVDKSDLLNGALCALACNNLPKAIMLYKRFMEISGGNDFRELITSLRDDSAIIKHLDIPTSNLRLVIDKLRYDLLGS